MTKKQKASATRRKRAAQNKAGRGGKQSLDKVRNQYTFPLNQRSNGVE